MDTGRVRHILVGLVLLTGCVATVEERPPRVAYVGGPPPPPLVDRPPQPSVRFEGHDQYIGEQYVWIEGYWHWSGVQYVWIPGYWESPR